MRHAFTIDVEDWYQGIPVSRSIKDDAEPRLERGMDLILSLLDERGFKGTFFFLGPIAKAYPGLVKRTADAGHELGCHGWSHDLLYEMTPERFRTETRQAIEAIGELTGIQVKAYRAAYFSITKKSLWALDILAELGFLYDSSIFPVKNWRYGIPDFSIFPREVKTASGPIYELPLSVRKIGRLNLPVSGGAYFRIYPYAVTRLNFRALEKEGRPVVYYLHPWELDPDHPRIPFHWKARLTHYLNLDRTESRLRRLMNEFDFGPLGEVLETQLG